MKRILTLSVLALTSTLALGACADGTESGNTDAVTSATSAATSTTETTETTETTTDTSTTAAGEVSAEHNAADIMFTRMMIPHHQQAVEMSEMLLAKENISAEVAEFAEGVIDSQGPEIDQMNDMLEAWGRQPVAGYGHMGDMDGMGDMGGMGRGGMSGMMTEEDMAALAEAQGTDAARLYLEQMTTHHEGAIDMARDEVANGENPQTIALSEQMIVDQEAEIVEMEQLLQNL